MEAFPGTHHTVAGLVAARHSRCKGVVVTELCSPGVYDRVSDDPVQISGIGSSRVLLRRVLLWWILLVLLRRRVLLWWLVLITLSRVERHGCVVVCNERAKALSVSDRAFGQQLAQALSTLTTGDLLCRWRQEQYLSPQV